MTKRTLALLLVVTALVGVNATAHAQDAISIAIEKHAQITGGGLTFQVKIVCGPLPGTADFREALAGAGQEKTGAGAEGGMGPDVVCDGIERTYTADVSLLTEATFKHGPARASATVIACNSVGDEQVCVQESIRSRIVISGRGVR